MSASRLVLIRDSVALSLAFIVVMGTALLAHAGLN